MAFSYQHEYHAGNHADIFKHICLTLILEHLCQKEKPFTIIDSHSAAGKFSLDDDRIKKTNEAQKGIIRLFNDYKKNPNIFPKEMLPYLKLESPYLENNIYAGSPEIEKIYLRNDDTLYLVEKHPEALKTLQQNINLQVLKPHIEKENKCSPKHIFIKAEDSFIALKALTPPLIKRGFILCDPSYEDASDYVKVTNTLKLVHSKWNTAIIALWYPLLLRRKNETAQMLSSLEDFAKTQLKPIETFRKELSLYDIKEIPEEMKQEKASHLYGSGMFLINPPWQLKEQLDQCINFLKNYFKTTA